MASYTMRASCETTRIMALTAFTDVRGERVVIQVNWIG
jgi:hypothetical protein